MPASLRPSGKARKIAYAILGTPNGGTPNSGKKQRKPINKEVLGLGIMTDNKLG